MNKSSLVALALAPALALSVAACSSTGNPSSSGTPTKTSSPAPTLIGPAQAAADFAKITAASVAEMTKSGLTQTVTNSGYGTFILVADKGASPKLQAAMQSPDGSVMQIADADSFAPYFAQELVAAKDPVLEANGFFIVTKEIEGKPQAYYFASANGLLTKETMTDAGKNKVVSDLSYSLPAASLAILEKGTKAAN